MKRKWSFIYEFDIQDWTLCLCGLSAIVISVIGFIGYWPFEQNDLDAFNKVMFFAVGLIISSLVSIFYIVKQIIKKIDLQKIKSYKTSFSYEELYNDISSANRICICGIEMFDTIGKLKLSLEQKAKQKAEINFLIADPDGCVIKMIKKVHSKHYRNE
ncbi:membrane protein [Candidatus Magnetomorum sp. HK-1]|nr:membrane protein [Candidatus Magnetomorum sp. HK-1]